MSLRNGYYALLASATLAVMSSSEAMAQSQSSSIGDIAKKVMTQVTDVGKLSVAASFLLGIIMVAGGLLKLKQASENQGQNPPYSAGLWRLALGAGLVALPAVTGMLTQSVFEQGANITTPTGF